VRSRIERALECRVVAGAVRALLALAALAATLAHAGISVVDDSGATVNLRTPARRIVTLAPHAAELVFAAGAGRAIVGVIKGTDYPQAATSLPIVGDAVALDLERITSLAPDLIVTWPWTTPAQVNWLRDRGIAVFQADARTVGAIAEDIERIGVLTGTESDASVAAAKLRARIAALGPHTSGEPLRVFYQVSDVPLFTLGGQHLVSKAIALCGGRNVFDELTIPAPQVGVEAVLAADPQVIVAGTADAKRPDWLDRWNAFASVAAAQRKALYVVDANLLHRPGPRFVDGVAQLCAALADARRRYGIVGTAPIIDWPAVGGATARTSAAAAADRQAR